MKKVIITLIGCLFLSYFSFAEYSSTYIKFQAVTYSKDTIKGYVYVYKHVDYEYVKNNSFEENLILLCFEQTEIGSIQYFEHIINYMPGFYKLISPKNLLVKEVKDISIIETYSSSSRSEILTTHKLSDTSWMKNKIFRKKSVYGDLCSMMIFMHDTSELSINALTEFESRLKLEQSKVEKSLDSIKVLINLLGTIRPNSEIDIETQLKGQYDFNLSEINNLEIEDFEDEDYIYKLRIENEILKSQIIKREILNQDFINSLKDKSEDLETYGNPDFDGILLKLLRESFNGFKIVVISDCGC